MEKNVRNMQQMQEILSQTVDGFYQCLLSDTPRLLYAGQNLCGLLRCNAQDLYDREMNAYLSFVYPADRPLVVAHVAAVRENAKAQSTVYRLQSTDGDIVWVKDTIHTMHTSDGKYIGNAVLTDITEIQKENETVRSLYESIPCGFFTFTCEKKPRVTYINQQMKKFLRIPDVREGEIDYLEMYCDNVFLMLPMEQRHTFAAALHQVAQENITKAGEITILRCDGTQARFYGWIKKHINKDNNEEFQAVCMDVTASYQAKKEQEENRYLKALTDIYDDVFEYDLSANTMNCRNCCPSSMFRHLENIPMQMQDATEKWIAQTVVPQDRSNVHAFFHAFFDRTLDTSDTTPPRMTYHAVSSDGSVRTYTGIFLKISEMRSYYCCRCVTDAVMEDSNSLLPLSAEDTQETRQTVTPFKDGIAAFEIWDTDVTPLYESENIYHFFGYSKQEWHAMMQTRTPLATFVARSGVPYTAFASFLTNGEGEFTYFDAEAQSEQLIHAICFPHSALVSPRYVLLYRAQKRKQNLQPSVAEEKENEQTVMIRTFGYFDVFVNGKPIAFRSQKSKELFALLVDRRGGFVSSEEAIGFLWEDEPVNSVTLARYRKVALRLKNILQEYGISEVVETVDGKRRIAMERVRCDLYDYLSGKPEYTQLFKGNYLSNYSWGEVTLGELFHMRDLKNEYDQK